MVSSGSKGNLWWEQRAERKKDLVGSASQCWEGSPSPDVEVRGRVEVWHWLGDQGKFPSDSCQQSNGYHPLPLSPLPDRRRVRA